MPHRDNRQRGFMDYKIGEVPPSGKNGAALLLSSLAKSCFGLPWFFK
jgi:hypothetical protein